MKRRNIIICAITVVILILLTLVYRYADIDKTKPQNTIILASERPETSDKRRTEEKDVGKETITAKSLPEAIFEPTEPQKPTKLEKLTAADFDAAFPQITEPLPVPENESDVRQPTSILIECDDSEYFLDMTGAGAIYRQNGNALTCLYTLPDRRIICDLQEYDGFLYFLLSKEPESNLYRIPCSGGTPELVRENVDDYLLRSSVVYARSNDGLIAFSIDAPEHELLLWQNTKQIRLLSYAAVPGGMILVFSDAQHTSEDTSCIFLLKDNGERRLLDYADNTYGRMKVIGEFVYIETLPKCTGEGNEIINLYQIDPNTGKKELFSTYSNENGSSYFWDGSQFYIMQHGDSDTKIFLSDFNGVNQKTLVTYENKSGRYAIEKEKLLSFQVANGYLYLSGYAYANGYNIITRIPMYDSSAREEIAGTTKMQRQN